MNKPPSFEIGENLTAALMVFAVFGVPSFAVAWIVWAIIRGGCP